MSEEYVIVEEDSERYIYLDVIDAGKLEISKSSTYLCGCEEGFSFGVQWGKHGYAGGVISQKNALKLAEHILRELDNKKLRYLKLKNL